MFNSIALLVKLHCGLPQVKIELCLCIFVLRRCVFGVVPRKEDRLKEVALFKNTSKTVFVGVDHVLS